MKKAFFIKEAPAPPTHQMLVQFLVEHGVKALVFGFEKGAISGDAPKVPSFTRDHQEIRKLVKANNSMLIYFVSFKAIRDEAAFERYKQEVIEALKKEGIDEYYILFANPP